VYGWVKPTNFDENGMTFNYSLWEPDNTLQVGEAMPITDFFTLSSGEQETLLINKCYDFIEGEKSACNGSEADIKYIDSSGQKSVEAMGDTHVGIGVSSDPDPPTKSECQAKDYMQGYLYLPAAENDYACVRLDYNGDTVYGWFRVTSFNNGGMTFDYQVWKP
jgi:hypothetical protein